MQDKVKFQKNNVRYGTVIGTECTSVLFNLIENIKALFRAEKQNQLRPSSAEHFYLNKILFFVHDANS